MAESDRHETPGQSASVLSALTVLTVSVLLATGVLCVAAATATGASVAGDHRGVATDPDDHAPAFVSGTVADHRGDVAAVNVSFGDRDVAYLSLGGPEEGYEFAATITDDDGDGYATVRLNTYAAGSQRGVLAGVASGSAQDVDESASSGALAVGNYSLSLSGRSRAAARDDPDATGSLRVRPRSNLSVAMWRTGANVSAVDDAAAITEGIANGTLARSEVFTAGDTVVAAVDAAGVEGLLAAQAGETTTERFLAAVESGELTLAVRQTAETTPPSLAPMELNLSRAAAAGELSIVEGRGDTYYVAFDASAEAFQRASAGGSTPEDGQDYAVRFGVTETARVADATETATATYRYRGEGIELGAAEYTLAAATNQTVTGTAALPPGSSVTVVVESAGAADGFAQRRTVAVGSDGTFRAAFDLSALAVGETLTVTAAGPTVENATATVVIGTPPSFAVSGISPPESVRPGEVVPVGVMVRNVGDVEGETTVVVALGDGPVATETVALDGGESAAVVVDVRAPDAEPGAYELRAAAGSNATTATVELRDRATSPPADPPPTTRPDGREGSTTAPDGSPSAGAGETAGGGSPGFTAVGSAVAALAALAALWRRY